MPTKLAMAGSEAKLFRSVKENKSDFKGHHPEIDHLAGTP